MEEISYNKNMNKTNNGIINTEHGCTSVIKTREDLLVEQVSKLIDQQILILKRIEAIELFLKS